jgi:hypothetical protein
MATYEIHFTDGTTETRRAITEVKFEGSWLIFIDGKGEDCLVPAGQVKYVARQD